MWRKRPRRNISSSYTYLIYTDPHTPRAYNILYIVGIHTLGTVKERAKIESHAKRKGEKTATADSVDVNVTVIEDEL